MKKISTTEVAANDAILSQAIQSSGLLFVSGQIHADTNWRLVGETPQEKFDVCMKNVGAILEAAGSSVDNIIKITIFVTDMSMISEINKVYAKYFTVALPAREAIGVAALPLSASLEVAAIAEAANVKM